MGELLQRRHRQQGVPGDRQLHRCAGAPVVAYQAQGQAAQGRDLSTLAPLRALRTRTLDCTWSRRAVGEGVKSCPRAGCGRSACPGSMECAAVKGVFSVMLSDLDRLLVTDLGARSSPAAAKRCAKGVSAPLSRGYFR